MSIKISSVSQNFNKPINFKSNETQPQQPQNVSTTTDTVDLANKKQETNWTKIAAWGAGILVAAGVAYCFIRKGKVKTSDIKETASTAAENIRKFFDKDNKLVEGVKLAKGKALAADGTSFTGIFKTTDKAGRNIAISYENGVMTSSKINDKLFKSYSHCKDKTTGNFTTTICEHLSDGTEQFTQHSFHDNGKIKYIRKEPKIYENGEVVFSYGTLAEYSKSGKKILEAQFEPDKRKVFAKFFDENGNMYKHQYAIWHKNTPSYRIQEDIISNGQVIKSRQHYNFNVLNHALTQEPHPPVKVIKNGINYTSGEERLVRTAKDCEVSAEYTQYGLGTSPDFTIESTHNGICTGLLSVDIDGNIKDTILPKDKNLLKDFFSKVEDLLKVAKEENMYTSIFDEGIANAPKWFNVLKEHFLK